MAAGLGVRCYSLCVSFHYVSGSGTIFGPYFLVPIGLASSLVGLEMAIASRRRAGMVAASAAPICLVGAALFGHRYEAVYMHFLELFMGTLGGSPAFLTLIAAIVVLMYAAWRGAPLAWELVAVALAALAIVGPKTITVWDTVAPRSPPLVAAGLVLAFLAARRHSSVRAGLAATLLVAGLTRACAEVWPYADPQPIALHLLITALLVVGAAFDDRLADLARVCGALLLLLLGLAATVNSSWVPFNLPDALRPFYPICTIVLAWSYGFWLHDWRYVAIAAANLAVWLTNCGFERYHQLRRVMAGLDLIAGGLFFFLVATAISLQKAGIGMAHAAKPLARLLARLGQRAWRGSDPQHS
jgi:hypothetical protein